MLTILPREHGATMIWLSATLLAFATLPEAPPALPAGLFLALSATALLALGAATRASRAILRLERSRTVLPALAGGLTLLTPAGHLAMTGGLAASIAGTWGVFYGSTVLTVAFAQEVVRGVLGSAAPRPARFLVPGLLGLSAATLALGSFHVLPLAALLLIAPLLVLWSSIWLLPPAGSTRKAQIRAVGFRLTGSMAAFIVLASIVVRL